MVRRVRVFNQPSLPVTDERQALPFLKQRTRITENVHMAARHISVERLD
jgi:hypothetical protein